MEENTLKYRRPDIEGGYLYNKEEIDYYRVIQRNDIFDNLMLGDYNMVGAYVINNAIVDELIKMNKVYTDAYAKTMFCESIRKFNAEPLHFCLNIIKDSPQKGKVTATLELLEQIDRANGYYRNTNSALVDSKIFDDSSNVNKRIFEYYHIFENGNVGDEKIEKDYELPNIIRRQRELMRLRELCLPTNKRLEKELFEKRIALLSHNIYARNILEEFNKQVFQIQDSFLSKKHPLYYRHLNQILDGILEQFDYDLKADKTLIKNLMTVQTAYAQKQMKQEAIRTDEIARKDDKERRDYFKKDLKGQKAEQTKETSEKKDSPVKSDTPKADFKKGEVKPEKTTAEEKTETQQQGFLLEVEDECEMWLNKTLITKFFEENRL